MRRVVTAINAQLPTGGKAGGIEQFVTGLITALGSLDGLDEYVIIGRREGSEWLGPHLGPNQRLVQFRPARSPVTRRVRSLLGRGFGGHEDVPSVWSEPFFDSLGADVVHFPFQSFFHCRTPAIFNPHDLQHCHYPEFFDPEQLRTRRALYPEACRSARFVATESEWTRQDVIEQFGTEPEKVITIYRGSPTDIYEAVDDRLVEETRRELDLPPTFALYPARTWPHKNHLALLEALAVVRDRYGLVIDLVCTGELSDFWPTIEERRHALGLDRQARFLGFVAPAQLRVLYRLAQFVVFPSLFEGGGFPLVEAFAEGVPATCSTATSLPEYAGGAALLFEPTEAGIADAIVRMARDESLRDDLRRRGTERRLAFSWEQAAQTYRALYHRAAGVTLTTEE
jgi:glycosyltransferase involved in cell wall biosynthesis